MHESKDLIVRLHENFIFRCILMHESLTKSTLIWNEKIDYKTTQNIFNLMINIEYNIKIYEPFKNFFKT